MTAALICSTETGAKTSTKRYKIDESKQDECEGEGNYSSNDKSDVSYRDAGIENDDVQCYGQTSSKHQSSIHTNPDTHT